MTRTAALSALLLALAGGAQAQVRSVEVRAPRSFGYFLGDLIQAQADITVDPGFSVQAASLPKAGPLAYWLDLRGTAIEETTQGDAKRIRLRLTYQNFYAALDSRPLEIPGFTVTLSSDAANGVTTAKAEIPAWSFTIAPLREVQPPRQANAADYMRPDGRVGAIDAQPPLLAAAGLSGLALIAFGLLARDRSWGPFAPRRGRPFGVAARHLRALARRPDADAAYREALLALHRGLDETDGRRVLADDLPAFLERHPAYGPHGEGLARVFAASRLAFFGRETAAARGGLPMAQVVATARRLAAAERAA